MPALIIVVYMYNCYCLMYMYIPSGIFVQSKKKFLNIRWDIEEEIGTRSNVRQ